MGKKIIKQVFLLLIFLTVFISNGQRTDFDLINFSKADSIADSYQGADFADLPLLTYNLTTGLSTDVEKFRSIYFWICNNIQNSLFDSEENIYKRRKYKKDKEKLERWNTKITKRTLKTLIEERKTVCTGYAYLLKQMSFLAGIECRIVDGYAKSPSLNLKKSATPNHSWNAVKLKGKWYLCDATWASGYSYSISGEFIFDYYEGYFLSNPNIFLKNHYPIEKKWALIKEIPSLENYIDAPLIYKNAYKHQLVPNFPKKMFLKIKEGETITFKVNSYKEINEKELNLYLIKGVFFKKVKPALQQLEDGFLLQTTFSKKGKYDVHVRYSKDILYTYVVKVK